MKTDVLVKVAFLAVIAYLLMLPQMALPIFPEFLRLDVSGLPALIGAMVLGPAAGILIELIKNLLHFITQTQTGGVGELANFVIGVALVVPVGMIYRRRPCVKAYVLGCAVGLVSTVTAACLFNYFVLLPFYSRIMPIEAIIAAAGAVNANVVDMWSLVLFAILPFNVVKTLLVTVAGYGVYRMLKPVLEKSVI